MKAKVTRPPLVLQGDVGGTIGFSRFSETESDLLELTCTCLGTNGFPSDIAEYANQVLESPLLMQQLGDRVYELMMEDLADRRERHWNYRRGLLR